MAGDNPGPVCSVQKHTQGVSAPTTGIWKHGSHRDSQSFCTLEPPKSSYAESCEPFYGASPRAEKQWVVSTCGSYWGSGSDLPGLSICLGYEAELGILVSPRVSLLWFPIEKDAQLGNLQVFHVVLGTRSQSRCSELAFSFGLTFFTGRHSQCSSE